MYRLLSKGELSLDNSPFDFFMRKQGDYTPRSVYFFMLHITGSLQSYQKMG